MVSAASEATIITAHYRAIGTRLMDLARRATWRSWGEAPFKIWKISENSTCDETVISVCLLILSL